MRGHKSDDNAYFKANNLTPNSNGISNTFSKTNFELFFV